MDARWKTNVDFLMLFGTVMTFYELIPMVGSSNLTPFASGLPTNEAKKPVSLLSLKTIVPFGQTSDFLTEFNKMLISLSDEELREAQPKGNGPIKTADDLNDRATDLYNQPTLYTLVPEVKGNRLPLFQKRQENHANTLNFKENKNDQFPEINVHGNGGPYMLRKQRFFIQFLRPEVYVVVDGTRLDHEAYHMKSVTMEPQMTAFRALLGAAIKYMQENGQGTSNPFNVIFDWDYEEDCEIIHSALGINNTGSQYWTVEITNAGRVLYRGYCFPEDFLHLRPGSQLRIRLT